MIVVFAAAVTIMDTTPTTTTIMIVGTAADSRMARVQVATTLEATVMDHARMKGGTFS
jgi:hypothetical protein